MLFALIQAITMRQLADPSARAQLTTNNQLITYPAHPIASRK